MINGNLVQNEEKKIKTERTFEFLILSIQCLTFNNMVHIHRSVVASCLYATVLQTMRLRFCRRRLKYRWAVKVPVGCN